MENKVVPPSHKHNALSAQLSTRFRIGDIRVITGAAQAELPDSLILDLACARALIKSLLPTVIKSA